MKNKLSPIEEKINSHKDAFVNITILGILVLIAPVTIANYLKIPELGLQPIAVVESVFLIIYSAVFALRRKISLGFKAGLVVLSFLLGSITIIHTVGLLSTGGATLVVNVVLASLYMKRKSVIAVVIISLSVFILYSYLWTGGYLVLPKEPELYVYGWSHWIGQIVSLFAMMILVTASVTSMMRNFRLSVISEMESSQKLEDMLKKENERLESLVAQRTKDLEKTTRELMKKEQLASLGGLVAGVAHEINTPLGVAVTASTFLSDLNKKAQDEIADGKFTRKSLVDFLEQVDETGDMINRNLFSAASMVKNFKQISVNQSHPVKGEFNLLEVVEAVVFTLKHEYKNTPHNISVKIPDNIRLNSYSSAYSQIITNLIMNSLVHAFNDGREGVILIEGEKIGDEAVLRYRDNGTGIPDDIQSHIYDPFFTTNRGCGGSGLGMSIVFNIVHDVLEGQIDCLSSPEEGTLFTITAPAVSHDDKERDK